MLFVLLMTTSTILAPAPAWGWRMVAMAAAVALGWRAVRTLVFRRGRAAVRRFEWTAQGEWFVVDGCGERRRALLAHGTGCIGPWILLVWKAKEAPRGTLLALIDATRIGSTHFRMLRGRLRLDPHAGQGPRV